MGGLGKLFVWGGANAAGAGLDTGAIYDVATNTWTPVAKDANTPSPRVLASAVWTGTRVFVWGGGSSVTSAVDYADGAMYDPTAQSWTPVQTAGAPLPRRAAYLFWTGSNVLLFAGYQGALTTPLGDAFLYDPAGDAWTPVSATNQPQSLFSPTVSWTGTELYVYGGGKGSASFDDFHRYAPASGWTVLSQGPGKRFGAFGGWDGAFFIAWGGRKPPQNTTYDDGLRYDGTWKSMQNGATARVAPHRESGWSARISSQNLMIVGGLSSADAVVKDGAIYNSGTNTWASVAAWPSGEEHRFGVGAFVGGEMVLWGGLNAAVPTANGERYRP